MRTVAVLAGWLLALAAFAPAAAADPVELNFDQDRIETTVGRVLTLESRITNSGDTATTGFVAHLNVTSLDSRVYVDLEDWSTEVTREVPPLAPRASTSITWEVQAVNAGAFNLYVVLLPDPGPLIASPPVRVRVAGVRTLDPGGALPVVLAVPLLLGLAAAGARLRPLVNRRNGSRPAPGR